MAELGSDIGGITAISWTLATVEGKLALAHAILRRLTTPRGGLIGDSSYGYAVQSTIGSTVPVSVVEQRVLEQVLAEEEVEDATVDVALLDGKLTVQLSVESAEGPFDLTITATALTTEAFLDGEQLFLPQAA